MKNLKISTRLSGAFALLVLMLVGLAVAAMAQLSSYQKEAPRLCRGGSRSLTFQEVVHRRDFQS